MKTQEIDFKETRTDAIRILKQAINFIEGKERPPEFTNNLDVYTLIKVATGMP